MSLFDEEQIDTGGAGCYMCRLWRYCKSPKLKPKGLMKKGILFVFDGPAVSQDREGRIDAGPVYNILKEELVDLGIDLLRDCRVMFAVCCKSKTAHAISEKEIDLCRSLVWNEIREHNPRVIVPLGMDALISIIGTKWKRNRGEFSAWEGLSIPDKGFNTWITPVYSPRDFIVTKEQYRNVSKEFEWTRQLKRVVKLSKKKIPVYTGVYPNTEHLYGDDRIRYLKRLIKDEPRLLAFDYETNCLKPQLKGAKIYSVSFAIDPDLGTGMLFDDSLIPFLKKIYGNRRIKKIASNMKFEDHWTNIVLGIKIRGWYHDTMICAHLEDNRSRYSGLKKQVYVHYGIPDYSEKADSYLHSKSSKELNTIHLMKTSDLLEYNALDSVFELRLALMQRKAFK